MNRTLGAVTAMSLLSLLTPRASWAQSTPDIAPAPKIIVVPYPGEAVFDAGSPYEQPAAQQNIGSSNEALPPPIPEAAPNDVPRAQPLPERTIEAMPPMAQPEPIPAAALPQPSEGPGAFIDGHPRSGAFLSGPGSLTFIMHHTLMTGLGVLATQMVPRINDTYCLGRSSGCLSPQVDWTDANSRIAYLTGGLVGAAVGFSASAFWQFNHWISPATANFGIINSFFGGAFAGAITDVISDHRNPTAISWFSLVGALGGAWLTAIVGGGDLAVNKGVLITSGGGWAMIYTALVLAVIGTTGGGGDVRAGLDALFILPAIGAAAMAFATLRFNPSTTQIMRANLFGLGAGAAVLLLSALVLGANFLHPLPYILAGVAAIGAKVTVSLLWAEAAESPQQANPSAFIPMSETEKRARVLYW